MTPIPLTLVETDLAAAAAAFGASFTDTGFAVVGDHGIDSQVIARADAAMRALFALPEPVKARYVVRQGGARGMTPFGIETAKDASVPDLKEFWHVGRDLAVPTPAMPANVWPAEVPDFELAVRDLFAALDATGRRVLRGIAVYLGLSPDWFDPLVANGNSVLRLLHYPPVSADACGLRSSAHEDINVITLLLGAEEAGLQLLGRDGVWRNIDVPPGAVVCNIGDMLQRLTNHRLPSTTHRVVNPARERRHLPRFSTPFFLHFAPEVVIRTLPGCIDAAHPDRYPDAITANAYLQARLREIGLL
jgi:isopenicillin N synthase-like dioxygenase